MFKLKANIPDFTVVDGDFAGRSYKAGELYEEKNVPPQEKQKFEISKNEDVIASEAKQSDHETAAPLARSDKDKGGKKS